MLRTLCLSFACLMVALFIGLPAAAESGQDSGPVDLPAICPIGSSIPTPGAANSAAAPPVESEEKEAEEVSPEDSDNFDGERIS
ncbi:MAG: hypothetical protein KDD47_06145, partial [Acidobacteria bacterium]|nr:hypothetical protein [Acidobacteriota bacterium]